MALIWSGRTIDDVKPNSEADYYYCYELLRFPLGTCFLLPVPVWSYVRGTATAESSLQSADVWCHVLDGSSVPSEEYAVLKLS